MRRCPSPSFQPWRLPARRHSDRGVGEIEFRSYVPFNGTGSRSAAFQIDGVNTDDSSEGQNRQSECGRSSAAVVSVQAHSARNRVHRDVYEFLQNETLNANSCFGDASGQAASGGLVSPQAPDPVDPRHRLNCNATWDVPWLRAQRGIAGKILGGWTVTTNETFAAGNPFTVTAGHDRNANGVSNDRPILLDQSLYGKSVDNEARSAATRSSGRGFQYRLRAVRGLPHTRRAPADLPRRRLRGRQQPALRLPHGERGERRE